MKKKILGGDGSHIRFHRPSQIVWKKKEEKKTNYNRNSKLKAFEIADLETCISTLAQSEGRKILLTCIQVERGERWTPPSIHGQRHHFLDESIFGRNSTLNKETLRSPGEALSPPTPAAEKRLQLVKMTAPNIYIYIYKEKRQEKINYKITRRTHVLILFLLLYHKNGNYYFYYRCCFNNKHFCFQIR